MLFFMSGQTVHIKSFGCQMNKLDTALVTSALREAGFGFTENVKEADAVLINTCSVREHAEQRVLSHLGHLKHIKEKKPDMVVGVVGCMAQRLGAELLEHDAVDIVCGPAQILQIAELVTEALQDKKKAVAVTEKIRKAKPENQALEEFESACGIDDKAIPAQAFVRAMRGCNKFCTYCIVPYVRGPEVSRPPEAIIEQIKKLADNGVKLVAMAELPKVCNYLHMPAQSSSDKILRAMNRNYTAEQYLGLLAKARAMVPGIAIAGDFIVGFPQETEQDFQDTVELVKKARYKNCFVFKYSPRPGTTADKRLEDNIPLEVKRRRNIELLAVQEKVSGESSREFLGRTVRVLVEGLSKKPHLDSAEGQNLPQLVGRTAEDWIVVFNGPESLAGKFAKVKITRVSPLTLFGELSV